MKLFSISILILPLLFIGCGGNEPDLGGEDEEYIGTYLVREISNTDDETLQDSIIFSVQRNTTYSMVMFYHIKGINQMCDNSGTILDWSTGKASFDPTNIGTNNCSNRSPGGTFEADFINFPGEIHLTRSVQGGIPPDTYDSLYHIILKQ